jgi:hypothetical protein
VNVTAASFEQIESWASEIITRGNAKPKGVEIWHGEERLASFGTAFRPERRRFSRRGRPQGQGSGDAFRRRATPENAPAGRSSWLAVILRSIWR